MLVKFYNRNFNRFLITLFLSLFSFPALAEINSGDTAWILTSTALVLFMTLPGLALFYAGLVNSKNVVSVLMQHFALACMVSVIWVVIGYSLAFSEGNSWIGGFGNIFMSSISLEESVFSLITILKPLYSWVLWLPVIITPVPVERW